jgi:peptide/nickel transport system ATP-binding protein
MTRGEIRLRGDRIDHLPAAGMRKIRGKRIGMVFQDPLSSLNPLFQIGDQIVETMRAHLDISKADARRRAVKLLDEVGIPAAASRVDSYPHQLSGGMRQRVVLALVLCTEPELIIADEPTTALDVSVQAQIIALIKALAKNYGTSVMLITHDLGVVAEIADRVAVMYAGRLVEIGSVRDVLKGAKHPYSQGLVSAIPTLRQGAGALRQIPGAMPRLHAMPNGCAFHTRCQFVFERCRVERPMPVRSGDIEVACWLHGKAVGAGP